MSRSLLALIAVAGLFLGLIGAPWLPQPPSTQELLANYAKVADYINAARSVHGIPWWTTSYLQGSSLAFLSFGALTNLILAAGTSLGGPYLGGKLISLAFLFLCPFTMYALIRRLLPANPWAAFACGVAYLGAPAILIRTGHVEHVSVVLAFAMLPIAFLAVQLFLEEQSVRSAVFCAVANGLLALAYVKITCLTLPLLFVFALWIVATRRHFHLPPWPLWLVAAGLYLILAVLPNLPAAREMGFVGHFDFGPFAGWQRGFSTSSTLSWLDRNSFLSGSPVSPQSAVTTPSSYLGLVGMACIVLLAFFRRKSISQTPEGIVLLVFLALALLAQWFAFGVYSPLTGHLAFLSQAFIANDLAIPLCWLLFVFPGWAIFLILPRALTYRRWWGAVLVLIYYCIPGFRIIEKLPLYGDIRAPHDFFEIGGVFCFSVAAGLAAYLLLREISRPRLVRELAILLIVAALADAGTSVPSFFKSPLDRATYQDFLASQDFLKNAPLSGKVYPFSGRYFYLLTPVLSGRPLTTEAYNSHLTLRRVAELQGGCSLSKEDLKSFLNISGVAYLLVDKQDPDTPKELQDLLRLICSPAFENDHFAVLENTKALAPAYFAKNYIHLPGDSKEAVLRALRAAGQDIGAVDSSNPADDQAGLITWDEKKPASLSLIKKISVSEYNRPSPEEINVTPPSESGWLMLPEAFHPDWKASQNGSPLIVAPAFHGLIGVYLTGSSAPLILSFQPPRWYDLCIWTSLTFWIFALGFLLAERLGLLPPHWRTALVLHPPTASPSFAQSDLDLLQRIVVIIPTYNESLSIRHALTKTLSVHPSLEILVVDDNSPDGTAVIVRQEPAFGSRIHLLERDAKHGLGQAYKAGFAWALQQGFDACIEMDADLSHNPDDIPRLLDALARGADAAIGSRYLGGVRVMNWPEHRLWLSTGAARFVRLITGLPLTDATSGFKALRVSALQKLDWKKVRTEGYGFQVELHYFLWQSGARMVEIPIVFTERRSGETKMTPGIAIEAAFRTIQLALARRVTPPTP